MPSWVLSALGAVGEFFGGLVSGFIRLWTIIGAWIGARLYQQAKDNREVLKRKDEQAKVDARPVRSRRALLKRMHRNKHDGS